MCPCPWCLTPKNQINDLGSNSNMRQWQVLAHVDTEERQGKVAVACQLIYQQHYVVDTPQVEALLKLESLLLSQPWHPINPVPLHPIASMHLPPVPLYVPTFSDYLYSPCIATDQWALCPVRLPIQLLNMFLFTIPVTLCSRPIILTNTIHLRESATNITGLTHRAVWAALVVGLPDSPSIALYILQ